MKNIQNIVARFGLGISKEKLASKVYTLLEMEGHTCCLINDRYLEVDGIAYQFIKSRKEDRWIVKLFA